MLFAKKKKHDGSDIKVQTVTVSESSFSKIFSSIDSPNMDVNALLNSLKSICPIADRSIRTRFVLRDKNFN